MWAQRASWERTALQLRRNQIGLQPCEAIDNQKVHCCQCEGVEGLGYVTLAHCCLYALHPSDPLRCRYAYSGILLQQTAVFQAFR